MSSWTQKAKAACLAGEDAIEAALKEVYLAAGKKGKITKDMDEALGILMGMDFHPEKNLMALEGTPEDDLIDE
jgi:HEPN domain-containing protein